MNTRIIPRLDIKGPNLVKGIHLEGLRVLGRPEQFAQKYYESGADELLYVDAVASLYGRNSLLEVIERTAREIFIPLTVGGGLRTVDDIRRVLRAGADKVAINTAAVRKPELLHDASRHFGSSTIVASVEATPRGDGRYMVLTDYGREPTDLDAVDWAKRAVDLGAGEVMVTSVEREGTGKGFDIELTRRVARAVSVPVIACGGAGALDHVRAVLVEGEANGVCIASMLHYAEARTRELVAADFAAEGNTEFLKNRRATGFTRVHESTVPEIKTFLTQQGIRCRPAEAGLP